MSDIKANRKSVRAPVVPTQIKGLLTRSSNQDQLPFLIWDVSEAGLGLWCTDELTTGEQIKLTLGQPYTLILDCEVMWVTNSPDNDGFRCGISVDNGDAKLKALYDKFLDQMQKNSEAAGSEST